LYAYLKDNDRESFYAFVHKNITTVGDIETYNPSAKHRAKGHHVVGVQEPKILDRYQRERMEKRNQRVRNQLREYEIDAEILTNRLEI